MSVDPVMDLTDPQQWNGYAYGNNSPFTFSDPSGLAYCDTNVCAGDKGYNPAGPRNDSNGGCVSNCGANHSSSDPGQKIPEIARGTNKAAYVPPASCSQFGYHAKDACVGAQSYRPTPPMSTSEKHHMVLDFWGLVPGWGEPADIANCGLYAQKWSYGDAALSCAGAIPILGMLATAAKSVKNGIKASSKVTVPVCPGFAPSAIGDAFSGMNKGGGHAIRKLIDEGVIPNKGSVASKVEIFEEKFSPVPMQPERTFDWKIGDTQARGFSGEVDGKLSVVFVAKEGPYQGKVLSVWTATPDNITKWGLR